MKGLGLIFIGGVLFGLGLAFSGLILPEVVLSFLNLEDLGLLVTMGGAILIALPVYQIVPRLRVRPSWGSAFERFPRKVTSRNIFGATIFGVGWGLSGICPGAAIASLGTGNWPIAVAIAGMLVGAYLHGVFLSGGRSAAVGAPA